MSLHGLLSCIDSIFHELKRHEEIENKCIMGQLQRRLTNEQISAIVSDVHKDSHVLEILSLVKKGIKSSAKRRFLNWTNFKERLTKAMTEFQKDFLPHMKHEEEVITSPFPTPPATSVHTHIHTRAHGRERNMITVFQ